jgi:hypothetical protein
VNEGSTNRITASYDGDGLRVAKSDTWTSAHNYTWGPGGVLFDSNNSSTDTPGFAQNQGGTDRYLHSDWIGSTRYLSDSTGNSFPGMLRYDAFGGRSSTGGTDGYYPSASQFAGDFGYQTEYASTTEPGLGLQYLERSYMILRREGASHRLRPSGKSAGTMGSRNGSTGRCGLRNFQWMRSPQK